ncbi:ribonuclease H [Senna tora]|uniref:Ribonuclease H n=1 Tax=Senna tora TaxID=362788 RepID=A0A834SIE4_9FABA|nr:ribonuclease H [Senna tora]
MRTLQISIIPWQIEYYLNKLIKIHTWNVSVLEKENTLDYENMFGHSEVSENNEASFCSPQQTPQSTHDQVGFDHPCDISHLLHQLDPQIGQIQNHVVPCYMKANTLWLKPKLGWVKVNTDGAVCRNGNIAGCGGLIRDHQGNWLKGFIKNVGISSPEGAEAWGILCVLNLAWELWKKRASIGSISSSQKSMKLSPMEVIAFREAVNIKLVGVDFSVSEIQTYRHVSNGFVSTTSGKAYTLGAETLSDIGDPFKEDVIDDAERKMTFLFCDCGN